MVRRRWDGGAERLLAKNACKMIFVGEGRENGVRAQFRMCLNSRRVDRYPELGSDPMFL